jgi:hypothetical protein
VVPAVDPPVVLAVVSGVATMVAARAAVLMVAPLVALQLVDLPVDRVTDRVVARLAPLEIQAVLTCLLPLCTTVAARRDARFPFETPPATGKRNRRRVISRQFGESST